jgi:hypothetical protein
LIVRLRAYSTLLDTKRPYPAQLNSPQLVRSEIPGIPLYRPRNPARSQINRPRPRFVPFPRALISGATNIPAIELTFLTMILPCMILLSNSFASYFASIFLPCVFCAFSGLFLTSKFKVQRSRFDGFLSFIQFPLARIRLPATVPPLFFSTGRVGLT